MTPLRIILRHSLLILCGYFFTSTETVEAQTTLSSVEIVGNSYFSQREILEKIDFRSGVSFVSVEPVKVSLVEMYRSEGFYNMQCDSVLIRYSVDSSSVYITCYIVENVRTLIERIVLSGNHSFPDHQLLELFETSAGSVLNPRILESDIRALLDFYSERGFPFTSVGSDSVHTDPDVRSKLIVHLTVDEGAKVFVDEVQIDGVTGTSSAVAAREVRLRRGEPFDQRQLSAIRKRIERLQIFSSVSDPQLYIVRNGNGDSLRGGVQITVKEGSTNTFDGIVGYVPSAVPNVDGYFTGNVFIALRNLFNTGRKALIKWQRETAVTQELELQYREPWLFGIPLNVGGSFFQRKQDSTYVKTKAEVRAEFAFSEELSLSGNVAAEYVYPSADLQTFSVFESNAFFIGAEILYDTRDNLRNPSGGFRYASTVQQGIKEITGPQKFLGLSTGNDLSIQKYSMDAEMYFSFFSRQVFMIGLHGKQINSSQLEVSDLFQLGGTNTVRGYRENQFFASQIAYINAEYRFLTGRASSFYGFADGGYFSRPSDPLKGIVRQERSIVGYGVGARIETGLGILNINYALGEGDSFSNGKIHVGIINEF